MKWYKLPFVHTPNFEYYGIAQNIRNWQIWKKRGLKNVSLVKMLCTILVNNNLTHKIFKVS